MVRSLLQQLSLSLRYLVSLDTTVWYRDSIVTLSIPATTQEVVKQGIYEMNASEKRTGRYKKHLRKPEDMFRENKVTFTSKGKLLYILQNPTGWEKNSSED